MNAPIRENPPVEIFGAKNTKHYVIDDNDEIFGLMSDVVYNDPMRAIMREYLSNAWDSHKEAGRTDQCVDITFSQDPLRLIIRDYGIGLDHIGMDTIFRRLFKSTKSETKDVAGKFGIGSKSSFAYTDNFISIGFKNGRKVVYSNHLGENRRPFISQMTLDPLGVPTDEPDGVLIDIPIKSIIDLQVFRQHLHHILETTTIKVRVLDGNGIVQPPQHSDFAQQLRIHGYGRNARNPSSGLSIVQDDICYPVPHSLTRILYANHGLDQNIFHGLYVMVESRSLQYPLSREQIRHTEQNIATLARILHPIQDAVYKELRKLVELNTKNLNLRDFISFISREKRTGMPLLFTASAAPTIAAGAENIALFYAERINDRPPIPLRIHAAEIRYGKKFVTERDATNDIENEIKTAKNEFLLALTSTLATHQAKMHHIYIHAPRRPTKVDLISLWGPTRCYIDNASPQDGDRLKTTVLRAKDELEDPNEMASLCFDNLIYSNCASILVLRPQKTLSLAITHNHENTRQFTTAFTIVPDNPKQSLEEIFTKDLRDIAEKYGFSSKIHIDRMSHMTKRPKPVRKPKVEIKNPAPDPSTKNFNYHTPVIKPFDGYANESRPITIGHAPQKAPSVLHALASFSKRNTVAKLTNPRLGNFVGIARHLTFLTDAQIALVQTRREARRLSEFGSTEIVSQTSDMTDTPTDHEIELLAIGMAATIFNTRDSTRLPAIRKLFTPMIENLEQRAGVSINDMLVGCVRFAADLTIRGRFSTIVGTQAGAIKKRLMTQYPMLQLNLISTNIEISKAVTDYIDLVDSSGSTGTMK